MSLKGVQDGVKDGGAHRSTHERHIIIESLEAESLFENGIAFSPRNAHIEAPARCIQNGGQNEHTEITVGELLSDSDDSFAISENSVIWLKSKCKNVNSVDFDCVVKSSDDQCDSSDGELFQGHIVAEGCGVAGVSKDMNNSVKQMETDVLDKSDLTTSGVSSDDFSNQGVTVHFGEFPAADLKNGNQEEFPLNIIQNFCVNKNESVSLMTPQELESLPNRGLEFEDSLVPIAYSSPTYHSNPTTSSPCKSVETTVSVSNETISKCPLVGIEDDISDELPQSVISRSEHKKFSDKDTSRIGIDTISKRNILSNPLTVSCSPSSPSSNTDSDTSPQSTGPTLDTQVDPANLTLATISISTDKAANSTQILVNTNQGQQLYLINTADLTQATNALQPLAKPPVPSSPVAPTPEVYPPPSSTSPPSEQNQSLVELPEHQAQINPLPLQIQSTGYFLLPMGQQEGSNSGILVTTPLNSLPESRKVWMCQEAGCDKVFRKLSKLKIHQMRHTGERPFKCSRHGCDWAFTTAYKLKRHEESHEGRKDYNCDFSGCGRKFTTVYNLNSHRKLHERPCTETCPEPGCGQCFPTKRQLDLHVRTHTGLEKTYKCPVSGCDKVFFSPNCMGSHTRVHLMDRQDLTCKFEGCGKVFDKQCRLKQHERRHTGEKPYVCQFQGCNWAFTTASKLKRHKAKHTGLRKWVCNLCNKGFMRAEHLKGHLVTHSGVKPFICPVEGCKARFTAKSSLYVHLKKHDASGKKITYHCPMEGCVRNYSSKAGLRNHILKHYLSTPAGSDQSTALDWVPLLGGDDDSMDGLTHSSPESVAGISPSQSSNSSSSLPTSATALTTASSQDKELSPAELINPDEDCLSAEQLSSSIVSQLIANSPLQPAVTSITAAAVSSRKQVGQVATSLLQPTSLLSSTKSQPKIAIAADAAGLSPVALENSSGSARTDYRSNHMLSERARRRWHRVKNGGNPDDDDDDDDDDSDVLDTALTDTVEKSDPASPLFSSDMLSSSQGVMFRDPETGITYVQTQLLQDDPPHPALYDDESSDAPVSGGTVSFTGTTINLQDLK